MLKEQPIAMAQIRTRRCFDVSMDLSKEQSLIMDRRVRLVLARLLTGLMSMGAVILWLCATQKCIQRFEPCDVREWLRMGRVAEEHGHL